MGNLCPSKDPSAKEQHNEISKREERIVVRNISPQETCGGSFPPIHSVPNKRVLRALYDYKARVKEDLSCHKGDKLELIDNENSDWWLAKHLKTGIEGFIPSSYVVSLKGVDSPETQEWWVEIDRRDSEKLLLSPGMPTGTYLVRGTSDHTSDPYALSIRDFDEQRRQARIKHYRIRLTDNGGCYIAPNNTFSSVLELIEHYKASADGLCCKLTKVCQKEPEPIPFKDLEVERALIQLEHKLGAGNFGEVYAAKLRNENVAVKTLQPGSMTTEEFLQEAKIMHDLRHKKLVQLMGVCTTESPIYIITELMVNGSLSQYLKKDNGETIKLPELMDMAVQIAEGMAYLETKNHIHRDLRAANILVGHNNIVKVADFGMARLTDDQEIYSAREDTKFPIKWTAPEAAYERKFSIKSDVWSFGILLYELVTFGKIPYQGKTNKKVLEDVDNGYRLEKPQGKEGIGCPDTLYKIMLTCWERRPEDRPTFKRLHRKLEEDYNYEDVY